LRCTNPCSTRFRRVRSAMPSAAAASDAFSQRGSGTIVPVPLCVPVVPVVRCMVPLCVPIVPVLCRAYRAAVPFASFQRSLDGVPASSLMRDPAPAFRALGAIEIADAQNRPFCAVRLRLCREGRAILFAHLCACGRTVPLYCSGSKASVCQRPCRQSLTRNRARLLW
jgi:hypothetical protein